MKKFVGEIVILKVTGKVAEKTKDGKLTGKMISFKQGDIGRIVSVRDSNDKKKSFFVKLREGIVLLNGMALDFPEDADISLSREAIAGLPSFKIGEEDMDIGAEY